MRPADSTGIVQSDGLVPPSCEVSEDSGLIDAQSSHMLASLLNMQTMHSAHFKRLLANGAVLLVSCLVFSTCVLADEVDDVLRLKADNKGRVKRFYGEVVFHTRQPETMKNPKNTGVRCRIRYDKGSSRASEVRGGATRVDVEVLEPGRSSIRVEGNRVSYMDRNGEWVEVTSPGAYQDLLDKMTGAFAQDDPGARRRKFDIKVVRHNNPIFGPRTVTLRYASKPDAGFFHVMEEDINDDGLVVETRTYNRNGVEIRRTRVKKHRKIKGVPFAEDVETATQTEMGEVLTRTTWTDVQIDTFEGE